MNMQQYSDVSTQLYWYYSRRQILNPAIIHFYSL